MGVFFERFPSGTNDRFYSVLKEELPKVLPFTTEDGKEFYYNNIKVCEFTNYQEAFYNMESGAQIFKPSKYGSSYSRSKPAYIAHSDNVICILRNSNGYPLCTYMGVFNNKPWFAYYEWTGSGTSMSYRPFYSGYFDATDNLYGSVLSSQTSPTVCRTSQLMARTLDGYAPINLLEFYVRQSTLPAQVYDQDSPTCYKMNMGGQNYISDGLLLFPYVDD